MYLVDTAYQACARFSSAGTFVNPGPWMHQERIIDSYEIMNPVRSTIFIECDSVPYAVKPNEILIIPPGVRHRGTRYSHKILNFTGFISMKIVSAGRRKRKRSISSRIKRPMRC